MRNKFLLLPLCIFLLSCSQDELPKYAALDRLRVLGIVVNTPEIQNPAAGTTNVQITPYLSDLPGSGTLSLEIQSCLDPGVNYGVEATCVGAEQASSVQTVTATFADAERTGAPTGALTVPLTIPANLLSSYSPALAFNGIAYLITVKVTGQSGSISSFRRVLISTKTPNQNPALSDLLANSASLVALPPGDVELSFSASASPETYQFQGTSGLQTLTEDLEVTWFVSDGEIENPRSRQGETVTWKAPASAPSGRQAVVVGVLRDGRGGLSVLVKKL